MERERLKLLRETELFGRVADADLESVARLMRDRRLRRNEVLFRQGADADALYIVRSGRLRVSASDQSGHEKVLAFLGTGEVVGEMGVLGGTRRSATVTASTDVDLLQLRRRDFDTAVATNPDAMRDLARSVARRRQATQQRVTHEAAGGGGYREGLVTAVFSPQGGAGTTTLATNIAVALAQRTPDQVILLDLNLLFGHVPVLLNIVPRTSLAAVSAVSLRQMDRENLEFYLSRHAESSLRVLSGTLRPEQAELVNGDHIRAALESARKQFRHVVVDLGRNFSEANLTSIEAAHNLLIVCTPERRALRNVSESQRIIRQVLRSPGDPMHYVVNHRSPYSNVSADDIEQTLGIELLASVPFGGDSVGRAALEGQPLVMRFPNSVSSRAIARISDSLTQQLAEARALSSVKAYLTVS
jgi:CRP-like cAMP-binding protein